jgi:hypothetical protein
MADIGLSGSLGAGGTALVGEAAKLRFELKFIPVPPPGFAGAISEALSSPAFCQEVEEAMQKRVSKKFGKEYVVQDLVVDVEQQAITASVSTLFADGFALREIAKRAAAVSEGVRSDLMDLTLAETGAKPFVKASWSQGDGLFDPSRMLSSDTPAPQLEAYLASLKQRGRRLARARNLSLFSGVLILFVAVPFALLEAGPLAAGYVGIYAALALVFVLQFNSQVADLDLEARDIANELDLRRIATQDVESRAQKLFQSHSFELKRYYDQALQQGRTIYFVGFACLFLGFSIIGGSLWLVVESSDSGMSEQIIIGSLGAIGGILANYIAVVYLRMFSETIQATTGFHQRLVMTHHLHFGNFLVAKISDDDLREDALAAMAEGLSATGVPAPNGAVPSAK